MKDEMTLRSGATIRRVNRAEADQKQYLTRQILTQMHLMPQGDPIAYDIAPDGHMIYYFDPAHVTEAPPENWYFPRAKRDTMTLSSGTVIARMSIKNAAANGYYTEEKLSRMHYEVVEEPVAYTVKNDKSILYFFDKKTAKRLPLNCVRCGKDIRYKKKLCRTCYEQELALRRIEGDAHRNAEYHMDRSKVLFFDLELTGFYDHDEILSITIVDAAGNLILDTLVRPVKKKKWKNTEKIHGITPDMVADAPMMSDLEPQLKTIFDQADNIIAYGVSTDYSHIKYIYADNPQQGERFRQKIHCCANEFVRYAHEHRPDIVHASLTDAMACFGIEWSGIAHTSAADTVACMKVWEALFPHYYEN